MEILEVFGTVSIVGMMISSILIGLFRMSFGTTKNMTPEEKTSYWWWGPSVLNKDLAKKAIPEMQFKKYWFFVQVQKFSVLGLVIYIFMGIVANTG